MLHSVNTEILSEKVLDSRSQLSRPMKAYRENTNSPRDTMIR